MDGLDPKYLFWGVGILAVALIVWVIIEQQFLRLGAYKINALGRVTQKGLFIVQLPHPPADIPTPYYIRRGDFIPTWLKSGDTTFWGMVRFRDGMITKTVLPDRMFFAHCLGHLVFPVNPFKYAFVKSYRKAMEAIVDPWATAHYQHPHVEALRLWLYKKENGFDWTGK